MAQGLSDGRTVTNASSPAEKVALFRALFRGREDVYARRWENSKTGKSGYSPCCAAEWVRGVCGKASGKANCATCPTRQFRALDDVAVAAHLRGVDAAGKPFNDDVFNALYDRFDGVTWYVQMILNRLWEAGEGVIDVAQVDDTVRTIIGIRDFEYADLLNSQNDASRRLLRAIAAERIVAEPQSGDFTSRAHLGAASTVRSALKLLESKDLVYHTPAGYVVYDRFFGEWLASRI